MREQTVSAQPSAPVTCKMQKMTTYYRNIEFVCWNLFFQTNLAWSIFPIDRGLMVVISLLSHHLIKIIPLLHYNNILTM